MMAGITDKYIIVIWKNLQEIVHSIFLFFPAFFIVCILYALTLFVPQAADVVVQSGEKFSAGFFTLLSLIFWSYMVWYSSRTMINVPSKNDGLSDALRKRYITHMPRFLAYNCFIVLQVAILGLDSGLRFNGRYVTIIILFFTIYYVLLTQFNDRNKKTKITVIVLSILYVSFLLYHIKNYYCCINGDIWNHYKRHLFWLHSGAILLFVMQIVAFWLYKIRRDSINKEYPETSKASKFLIFMSLNEETARKENPYFNILNAGAILGLLIFSCAWLYVDVSNSIGSLTIVILSLSMTTGAFNLFKAFSRKINFPVGLSFFLFVILINIFFRDQTKTYSVRVSDDKRISRIKPIDYFGKWTKNRNIINDKDSSFTAYIILSDGGASRAGNWAGLIMSTLQDSSKGKFLDHLFCISGASGGSVGNAVFYSVLKNNSDSVSENKSYKDALTFRDHLDNYFRADFLTFTLTRFLGTDLLNYTLPVFDGNDRSIALETALETASSDSLINNSFKSGLVSVFDSTGRLPAFFISSTSVKDGMPSYVSNIQFDKDSILVDILKLINKKENDKQMDTSMNLSTAVVLSARFPYVSPAGKIDDHYFVDGGYADNAGTGLAMEYLREIKEAIKNTDLKDSLEIKYKRINFKVIRIINGGHPEKVKGLNRIVNDLAVPFITLNGVTNANVGLWHRELNYVITDSLGTEDKTIYFHLDSLNEWQNRLALEKKIINGEESEGFPMSWVNSEYQQQRTRDRMKDVTKTQAFKKMMSEILKND